MATGDILSVAVGADGWYADITIEGLSTGGTYNLGLGTYNVTTGAPKVVFTVVSKGFDDTGAATTITRTVYGTRQVRKAYPNQATNEESTAGGNVTVRVALSEYIYQKDNTGGGNSGTAPTVTILSGFYTQAATPNNAATNMAVTNNSTAAYQKPVGNWSWPGYELLSGTSHKARAVVFHRHGQQGRPVRCVKFTDTDGTNTATTTVTQMTIDAAMSADAVPVVEYVGTMNHTSLTQSAVITRNFIAYPWVGDEVLDTSTGTAPPSPLVGPQKYVCDKNSTYGITMALVDPINGNDTTGTAYDSAVYNPATALKFLTIGKAASAIAAYNNANRSRNSVGGGIVELEEGSYNWVGSSNTYGTTPPDCVITIRGKTGTTRSAVMISGVSTTSDLGDRVKLENLTITSTTNNTFVNIAFFWVHNCEYNCGGGSATGMVHATGNMSWYNTHCLVTGLRQGFHPFNGAAQLMPALVRGCNLDAFTRSILVYTVLGNKRSTSLAPVSTLLKTEIANQTFPTSDGFIIAYNKLLGYHLTSFDMITVGDDFSRTGGAIVQNVFEVNQSNGTPNLMFTYAGEGETDNTPGDNIIYWHNTRVGGRCGTAYNSAGSIVKYRRFWSWKNSYDDSYGIKADTFGTPNAARIGNWPVLYGVGHTGNVDAEINGTGTEGSFPNDFPGISCRQQTTGQSTATFPFVNRASYTGSNGAGGGDYTLTEASPTTAIDWLLPYDLAGNARSANNNVTGAFALGAAGDPPTFTTQPAAATYTAGDTFRLTALATGTEPITYQWRKDGVNLSGETGTQLVFRNATTSQSGNYDVVATNDQGSATSNSVAVLVNAPSFAVAAASGGSGNNHEIQLDLNNNHLLVRNPGRHSNQLGLL
jgi:hypothetical protein